MQLATNEKIRFRIRASENEKEKQDKFVKFLVENFDNVSATNAILDPEKMIYIRGIEINNEQKNS